MIDFRENLQKCHEYVRALEEERRKIEMFRRELPLCLEIITQALDSCKQQLTGTIPPTAAAAVPATATATTTTTTDCRNGHSECSEQTTTSQGPVFEEFMPIKGGCFSSGGGEDDEEDHEIHELETSLNSGEGEKKLDWLRSAQLWNQSPDPPTPTAEEDEEHQIIIQPRKVSVVEVKSNGGGGFHPFGSSMEITTTTTKAASTAIVEAAVVAPAPVAAPAGSSCSTAERDGKKEDKDGQGRKSRRCWSPELHRRFLGALEQLGGPHVATPKQIRELMKVDGLTNDEVKSHLQKYRLHARRPSPAVQNNAGNPPHQFVVVGGLWVPPTEYAGASTTASTASGTAAASPKMIYAPVAAAQARQPARQSSGNASENGVTARCNSPAASSSARAATAC